MNEIQFFPLNWLSLKAFYEKPYNIYDFFESNSIIEIDMAQGIFNE